MSAGQLPTLWSGESTSGLLGHAVMVYTLDVRPEDRELLDSWYTHEHLPERVGTPGFIRGRRYLRRVDSPGAEHLTIYETTDVDVFVSRPYLDRLDRPSPLTRQAVTTFVNPSRNVMRVAATYGAAIGRELSLIRAPATTELLDQLVARIERVEAAPEITGIHLTVTDASATDAKSGTSEGQGAAEGATSPDLALLVEGTGATVRTATALAREVPGDPTIATYDLTMVLDHAALQGASAPVASPDSPPSA